MPAKAEQIVSTGAVLAAHVAHRISAIASGAVRDLPTAVEAGGLLTASMSGDGDLTVDGIELVEPESSTSFAAQCEALGRQAIALRDNGQCVVGYFRTSATTVFSICDLDVQLVRECIPECRYILLVRPDTSGVVTFRVFRTEAEGKWRLSSEFGVSTAQKGAASSSTPGEDQRLDPPERSFLRRNLLLSGFAGCAALIGILIFLYLNSRKVPEFLPDHRALGVGQVHPSVIPAASVSPGPVVPAPGQLIHKSAQASGPIRTKIHRVNGVSVQTMTVTPAEANDSGYRGPQAVEEFMPSARSLGKSLVPRGCEIMVQVGIADNGSVTTASIIRDVPPDQKELAEQVLEAAKRWIFQPATTGSTSVESKQVLIFHFRKTAR